jgi:hypothetical protein
MLCALTYTVFLTKHSGAACIQEVLSSNLGHVVGYPDCGFFVYQDNKYVTLPEK